MGRGADSAAATGRFDLLASLYDPIAPAVRRRGLVYPVAVDPLGSVSLVLVEGAAAPVVLTPYGNAHLRRIRQRCSAVYDGELLALDELDGATLRVRRTSYFAVLATCDALRVEFLNTTGSGTAALPVRFAAHVAVGKADPVRSGVGRAAAVGVSVVLTVPTRSGRAFLLGQRHPSLPADPGIWQVAPSGMLEPGDAACAVGLGVARELEEELGVPPATAAALAGRTRVLGLAHDLTRLRPDVCLMLDLSPSELSMLEPALRGPARSEEFTAFDLVEISAEGLAAFWRDHPPDMVTPATAGAVALLEAVTIAR